MKKISILLLWLVAAVATSAQTKIVVLSDTHVMSPDLLVSDGPAWQHHLERDRKMLDKSRELFDAMIERLKTELKPQLVLITGDLTKDGELSSHEYVARRLDELQAAGIHTLVIPGNHDLGTRNAVSYDGDTTHKVETPTKEIFAKLYKLHGYGDNSDREQSTLTYAVEPIQGLVVIGIDSGEKGRLSTTTLNWVCDKAQSARTAGKQVIAMMHHPLFPHFHGVDKFVETAVISNYEQVRNRLADAGIGLIFTGHFHTSDIAKSYNADLTKTIYDVNTGSLISYPCDYREVQASPDLHTFSITTGHISSLPDDALFSNTSKTRLATSIKRLIENMDGPLSLLADDAANCFLVHAEGNEHQSPKGRQLLSKLEGMLIEANELVNMMPQLKSKVADAEKMAHSILKDISEYGIPERENQTDDLTLTIEFP
jgi:3',5'-cyclic AMP phosphodiesterase CpdA